MLKLLLRIGLVTRCHDGTIRWPLHVSPWHCWRDTFYYPDLMWKFWGVFYVFRNRPGVIKWREGRLLPVRWGFGIAGLIEFGDRG